MNTDKPIEKYFLYDAYVKYKIIEYRHIIKDATQIKKIKYFIFRIQLV